MFKKIEENAKNNVKGKDEDWERFPDFDIVCGFSKEGELIKDDKIHMLGDDKYKNKDVSEYGFKNKEEEQELVK
jgi:hypothetical protein